MSERPSEDLRDRLRRVLDILDAHTERLWTVRHDLALLRERVERIERHLRWEEPPPHA